MKIEHGIYSVLMTPFNNDYGIDFNSYDKLLQKIYESNITGVVALGTTSEAPTLSLNEKIILVKYLWKKFNGNKKVVVGIGGNNTYETLNFALKIKDYCDYMMITVPNYNKPSQKGIQKHFEFVCNHEQLKNKPFVLYNVPSRCGVNLEPITISEVYNSCENVCAVKEASGSLEQALNIRSLCDIQIFSGDDSLTVPIMSIGGCGVISVIANILPNVINEIYNDCVKSNYSSASREYVKLHKLVKTLFIESNPVPGKELLKLVNIFSNSTPRLPLVKMSNKNKEILFSRYYEYGNDISSIELE